MKSLVSMTLIAVNTQAVSVWNTNYKEKILNFDAITGNISGNTLGWTMGGSFIVYTKTFGGNPNFWVELDVYPAPGENTTAGSVY